jgi:hypothetical protein
MKLIKLIKSLNGPTWSNIVLLLFIICGFTLGGLFIFGKLTPEHIRGIIAVVGVAVVTAIILGAGGVLGWVAWNTSKEVWDDIRSKWRQLND